MYSYEGLKLMKVASMFPASSGELTAPQCQWYNLMFTEMHFSIVPCYCVVHVVEGSISMHVVSV